MKNINFNVWFIVFFYLLHTTCCSILNITTDGLKIYGEIMNKIFLECHPDYQNIIFYDDRFENNYKILSKTLAPSYIRMNSSTLYKYDQIQKIKKTTRIDAVVVAIYEIGFIGNFMNTLLSLELVDIETPFYIFSRLKDGCIYRKSIIRKSWELKLLSTIFICYADVIKTPIIYAFNPYATCAPQEWSVVTSLIEPNNPLRIFSRRYRNGEDSLCSGFDFDRTRCLNNTVMRLGVELELRHSVSRVLQWNSIFRESLINEFFHDNIILQLLKQSMNIRYEGLFIDYRTIKELGYKEVFDRAYNSQLDLIMFNEAVLDKHNFTMSYPYKIIQYKIVSQTRGRMNFFEHMYYVLGLAMIIMMGILIFLTFFVVWLSNRKRTIAFAFFEILRLLISASFEARMNTASLKIYYMVVLFYFMIVQTLFQGELANFFTHPPLRELPKSIEQLETLQYERIFYFRDIVDYVNEFEFMHSRMTRLRYSEDCKYTAFIENNYACIIESKAANYLSMMYLLYSSPVVHQYYKFYITRQNSPLKNRINKAFLQLWESGFSSLITEDENNAYSGYIMRRNAQTTIHMRSIKNRDFRYMYLFLGIGLSLSIICFIFELVIYNHKIITVRILNNKSRGLMILNRMWVMLKTVFIRKPRNN